MYWDSSDYEAMSKKVIDIYLDYEIRTFPVDEIEICKKLGVKLLPYSEFPDFVKAVSEDAFYVSPTTKNPPIIFYNDLKMNEEGEDIMFFMSWNILCVEMNIKLEVYYPMQ